MLSKIFNITNVKSSQSKTLAPQPWRSTHSRPQVVGGMLLLEWCVALPFASRIGIALNLASREVTWNSKVMHRQLPKIVSEC